ncbi:helix-turn-helix domain-containing protein [Paraburkholderia sediminicola]|uniref:helix-turn-helix domain-containing protein n=1 Tax=Paraburkholderia sediminicola TaxID=458836 RepID=UPI0038B72B6D
MKTPLKRVLAKNVKRLMGLVPEVATQAKLAARAHMSQSSVHRILNEDTEPEIETVQKLANAIGVSVATLLTEDQGDELPPFAHEKYRALPLAEKEKIKAFIDFVIASHEAEKAGVPINFSERLEPTQSARATAQELAQRQTSDHTLTSHERKTENRGPRKKSRSA